MNVQKNNANEGIIIEENNLSRYEITFTQNFLEFFTDPNDKEGKLESVSPEKLFGDSKDKYATLATPEKLVKESSRK